MIKIKKAFKKSVCAWCNKVIGFFPIEYHVNIVSHGICDCCFKEAIRKSGLNNHIN